MSIPSVGTRSFEYDRLSDRRKSDSFESAAGASNHVDYRYETTAGASAYDRMGNLTRVHATFGGTASPPAHEYEMEYAYDARNRIQQWTMDGVAKSFDYDARGNMTSHAGEAQTFAVPGLDPAHAIQSRTANENGTTYDYAYTYDGAGNLLSRSRSTGGSLLGTSHYKFDGRGRLVCVGTTGPGSCNTLAVTYNGVGERVKETGSKNYLYAGPGFRLNPDAPAWDQEYWIEIEALGERIAYKYVIGGSLRTAGILEIPGLELTPREREVLIGLGLGLGLALVVVALGGIVRAPSPARAGLSVGVSAVMVFVPYQAWAGGGSLPPPISGTAVFRWVVSDAIGSSLVEIDGTGSIVSRSAYRPFGGIEQQWGSSGGAGGTSGSGSRSYYAGHDRQTDTGLVYMNARWMDPGSGGFISVDPVISNAFEPKAYNGYSYVENNPIMLDDPTGMGTMCVIGAINSFATSSSTTTTISDAPGHYEKKDGKGNWVKVDGPFGELPAKSASATTSSTSSPAPNGASGGNANSGSQSGAQGSEKSESKSSRLLANPADKNVIASAVNASKLDVQDRKEKYGINVTSATAVQGTPGGGLKLGQTGPNIVDGVETTTEHGVSTPSQLVRNPVAFAVSLPMFAREGFISAGASDFNGLSGKFGGVPVYVHAPKDGITMVFEAGREPGRVNFR